MSAALQTVARGTNSLELTPDPTLAARHRMAVRDLADAWKLWRLCWTLAWLDIKLRYRGSLLGPFWLTLSTALMVASMGAIYASLFHMNLHEYLPFLTLSLVLWGFISTLVGDACVGFTASEGMIRSVRMPFALYAGRIVVRNVVVLAHNVVVVVAVFAIYSVWPGTTALLALPGSLLWLLDALALSITLGAVCARYRDIPPIVGSLIQMMFFVTPVIWRPELVGKSRMWLLPFNPFSSILEVVRGPLMGEVPSLANFVSAGLYSLLLCAISWALFVRVRNRIAFWV